MKSSFLGNVFLTALTQGAITIINIIILSCFSHWLPEEGMGAYLTIRRFIGVAFGVVTLNLNMSLSRFISFKQSYAPTYFFQSAWLITLICVFGFLLLSLTPGFFSLVLFGDVKYQALLIPSVFFLFANSLQILCMGYFQGNSNFKYMNLLDLCFWAGAIISLVVFYFSNGDTIELIRNYFFLYGIIALLNCVIFMFAFGNIRHQIFTSIKSVFQWGEYRKEAAFFKYGIDRLPHGVYAGLIFFIPIFVANNFLDLKQAAYIGIVISIVRMVQLVVFPLNIIFLPKFSQYQAAGEHDRFRKDTRLVIEFCFSIPLLISLYFAFLADEIVSLWFGSKYQVIIPYAIGISPFLFPLLSHVILRGIIDGASNKPLINRITLIACIAVAVVSLISVIAYRDLWVLVIGEGAGLLVLGWLSLKTLTREQNLPMINRPIIQSLAWAVCVALVLAVYLKTTHIENTFFSLSGKLAMVAFLSLMSFWVYQKIKPEWFEQLVHKLNLATKLKS